MINDNKRSDTDNKSFSTISTRSFLAVVCVLLSVIILCGALSYVIPQGSFEYDADTGEIIPGTFVQGEVDGIEIWRVISAPVRVFASGNAITVIMISIFLLVMSGVFNLLEKTGGIRVFIARIMCKLRNKGGPVVCLTVLIFMLFGSFFGMFEELVTLLPIIIVFMLSMGLDTMTGLGACMLAACFGFSAAITNPFSVGLAAEVAGVNPSTGVWLRLVFFVATYVTLCVFLMIHLRRIERSPMLSPSFEQDEKKRETLDTSAVTPCKKNDRLFKVFTVFFSIQAVVLVLIASVKAIASYAIPILAVSFLIPGIICGLIVSEKRSSVWGHLLRGAIAMLPAVLMIALASSVTLIMDESGIMETIMNWVINLLDGKSKYLSVVLIYLLILFLQFFIGSASAKIFLVMPIVMPVAIALGLSPAIVILAYCMADGFTDVILPTNPILLVGLSMANVSYVKWVRWTWKLQLAVFALGIGFLMFGVAIGY